MELRNEILLTLEKDSRISPQELAIRLGTDEATIVNEVALLEKEGIICGYLTLINWDKTGNESVTALIEVKVTPQRGNGFDSIAERIYKFREVKAVYLMSGGFDFTVIVESQSMREAALFVSEKLSVLEYVLSTSTHFVLKRYKDHGIIFEEEKEDKRISITP